MTAFATADELAIRFGLTFTDDEATRADAMLAEISDLIRDAAQQDISLVEDDVYERNGTTDQRIVLPQRPVVSVASVTLDGTELAEGGTWYLDGNAIVRKPSFFADRAFDYTRGFGNGFGFEWQTLRVVYTHGYEDDAIPQRVKTICKEAVVRAWVNPGSVIQEAIAGEQVTYAPYSDPPRGLMLTDVEERALRRLFGRKARTVHVEG